MLCQCRLPLRRHVFVTKAVLGPRPSWCCTVAISTLYVVHFIIQYSSAKNCELHHGMPSLKLIANINLDVTENVGQYLSSRWTHEATTFKSIYLTPSPWLKIGAGLGNSFEQFQVGSFDSWQFLYSGRRIRTTIPYLRSYASHDNLIYWGTHMMPGSWGCL